LREDGSFKRKVENWGVMGETADGERFIFCWNGIGEESERFAKFVATALYNFIPLVKLINEIHAEIPERKIIQGERFSSISRKDSDAVANNDYRGIGE
jgi:hypothetical protein